MTSTSAPIGGSGGVVAAARCSRRAAAPTIARSRTWNRANLRSHASSTETQPFSIHATTVPRIPIRLRLGHPVTSTVAPTAGNPVAAVKGGSADAARGHDPAW